MKVKFLIDANLPYYFALWKSDEYVHQFDLGDNWPDDEIWRYAETNNLTIVSKDSDFSNRILLKSPPPKVIHIKIGNRKMKDFFNLITSHWPQVTELNKEYKLINVFEDRIEAIN